MKLFLFFLILLSLKLFSQGTSALTVSIKTTPFSCNAGTAKINVSGGITPYNFNWSNGFYGDFQENMTPGLYNVTIVQANGKDTTVSLLIEEQKCLVSFDQTFSPNGDGINDTWNVFNWKYFPNFKLCIYNRWGQLVHKQEKEFFPWDGKHLGVDLPIGAYYYIFYYSEDDSKDFEKGSIILMR
jgi:gliding motility-associated-like protein